MKKFLVSEILLFVILFFSACQAHSSLPQSTDEQTETSSASLEAYLPHSDSDASVSEINTVENEPNQEPFYTLYTFCPFYQIDFNEYYSYGSDDTVLTVDELKNYLKKTVLFHNAAVNGPVELWTADLSETSYEMQNTQFLTYPVLCDDEKLYFGVDRKTGIVYQWSDDTAMEYPQIIESPEIFSTPFCALAYTKNNFWNSDSSTASFDLELIPGNLDSPFEEPYPYYVSQEILHNDTQTSTYYIEIDALDEQSYTIHYYEAVTDSSGGEHPVTKSWLTIYKNGFIRDNLYGKLWVVDHA